MGRRSASNPRYRKDATIGKTRRSAASAKPKREIGAAPIKASSSAGKGSGGKADRKQFEPDTPEYKQLRRVWFGLLIVAIVSSLAGYFLREVKQVGQIALIIAYASLFTAIGLDMLKIRPMRKAWEAERSGKGKKAATGKAKAEGADAETTDAPGKQKASSDEGKA